MFSDGHLEKLIAAEQFAREIWDDDGGSGMMGPQAPSHVAQLGSASGKAQHAMPEGVGPLSPGSVVPVEESGPEASGYEKHKSVSEKA